MNILNLVESDGVGIPFLFHPAHRLSITEWDNAILSYMVELLAVKPNTAVSGLEGVFHRPITLPLCHPA